MSTINFLTYYKTTGVIKQSGATNESCLPMFDTPETGVLTALGDSRAQYVDLASLAIASYTGAERSAKDGMLPGFVWQMPERIAVDARTLAQAKDAKLASLSELCRAQITAGFTSSSLGAVYSYPAKPLDQSNLTGSVLASLLPGNAAGWTTPFWCADSLGVWAFRNHTTAQIQTVGTDAKAALLAALGKNQYLGGQVAAAIDAAGVAAVVW